MSTPTCCPSCGQAYDQHPGLIPTCAKLQEARKRIFDAKMAMLKTWPDGVACRHEAAREVFALLEAT